MDDHQALVARLAGILVGLEFHVLGRMLDVSKFGFGPTWERTTKRGTESVPQYSLHVSSRWSLEPDGGLHGGQIRSTPGTGTGPLDGDPKQRSSSSETQVRRKVFGVSADSLAVVAIELSDSFELRLISGPSPGEKWRLFKPSIDGSGVGDHIVLRSVEGQLETFIE